MAWHLASWMRSTMLLKLGLSSLARYRQSCMIRKMTAFPLDGMRSAWFSSNPTVPRICVADNP